jgi:hypothetical protein
MGSALTRVSREGGADVAEAEEANPAGRRDTSGCGIDDGRGRSRRVEHDRVHDERSVGSAMRYTRTAETIPLLNR